MIDDSRPIVTRKDLIAGFLQLGLRAGSGVMVHASLSSFGHVQGGAGAVIGALMAVITPEGTLMMPSFNHGAAFAEGSAGYYHPAETHTTNGAIPDHFWQLPGVYRSLNPTHAIAAWGKHARRYTQHHHRTLTMGIHSPLGLLGEEGGYGLLLGVDFTSNTYHHVVEMSTGAPCLGQRTEAYPVELPDGRSVMGRTWGWRSQACPINDEARYAAEMRAKGLVKVVNIGACQAIYFRLLDCYTVDSGLLAIGMDSFPPCSRCPVRPKVIPQTVPSDWDAAHKTLLPESTAWEY